MLSGNREKGDCVCAWFGSGLNFWALLRGAKKKKKKVEEQRVAEENWTTEVGKLVKRQRKDEGMWAGAWRVLGSRCEMGDSALCSLFLHLACPSSSQKWNFSLVAHPQSSLCHSGSFLRKKGTCKFERPEADLFDTVFYFCTTFLSPSVVFYEHPTLLQTIPWLFRLDT